MTVRISVKNLDDREDAVIGVWFYNLDDQKLPTFNSHEPVRLLKRGEEIGAYIHSGINVFISEVKQAMPDNAKPVTEEKKNNE
jgi:hypothetical protein